MSVQLGRAPEDAVVLTEDEAKVMQWKLFNEWTPVSDIWAVRYGGAALAMVSGISGYFINKFYRKALKLGKHGHFSTYLPITILPAAFSFAVHQELVTSPIILQKIQCTVCTELRALALQSSLGMLYPLVLAPISNYMLASRLGTVRIPMMYFEMKKLRSFHMKLSGPLYKNLWIFVAVNLFTASALTYLEMRNSFDVFEKINEMEREMIAKGITFTTENADEST